MFKNKRALNALTAAALALLSASAQAQDQLASPSTSAGQTYDAPPSHYIQGDPAAPIVAVQMPPNGGWGGVATPSAISTTPFTGPRSIESISTLDGRTIVTNPPPIEGCNAGLVFYPHIGKYWCSSLALPAGFLPPSPPPPPPPPGPSSPPPFAAPGGSGGGAPGTLRLAFGGNGSPLGYAQQVAAYQLSMVSNGGFDSGSCLTSPGASGVAFVQCTTATAGAYGFNATLDGVSGAVSAVAVPDGSGGWVNVTGLIGGGGTVSGSYSHILYSGTWQVVGGSPGVLDTRFAGNRGAVGGCSFAFADAGGGNFSLSGPCALDSGGAFTASGMAYADGTVRIPFNDVPFPGFVGAFYGNWSNAGASGAFYSASQGTFSGGVNTAPNAPIVLDVYFNAGNAFIGTALATPNGSGYILAGQSSAGLFAGSLNLLPSQLLGGGISINGGAYVAAVANEPGAQFGTAFVGATRYAIGAIINGGAQFFAVDLGGGVAANGSIMAVADNDSTWVAFFAQQGQATDGGTLQGTFNSVLFDGSAYYPGTASGGTGTFRGDYFSGSQKYIRVSQP